MTARRAAGVAGRVLVVAGLLLLLFVVYQLWGTGILTARHQAALRTEFNNELRHVQPTPATTRGTTAPSGIDPTTTTVPSRSRATGLPPPEGQPVGVIQIPKINVDKVVVQGTSEMDLGLGPGHYPGTPLPGQIGNSAIAGHRTTYGAPFFSLNLVAPGDSIYVTTLQGRFHYVVTSLQVVVPSDVAVVAPTRFAALTLTTCDPPFSAANRLVVQARLVGRSPLPDPPPISPVAAGPGTSSGTLPSGGAPSAAPSGLAGTSGGWLGALWWGLGLVALSILEWRATRGRSWKRRWAIYLMSVPLFAVVLFFFFEGISALVPPTF